MGHAEIVVHMIESQLTHAVFPLAQHGDPSSRSGDMLTNVEVNPFDEGSVDLPTPWRHHLLDSNQGAGYHAMCHAHQTPATPPRGHHLGWQRHESVCGRGSLLCSQASQ